MRRTPVGLKVRAVVTVLSCDDLLVEPEGYKDLTHMWPRTVALWGPEKAAVFYSVIWLHQVKEDKEEGVLVDAVKLLGKIELHGRRARASPWEEPV